MSGKPGVPHFVPRLGFEAELKVRTLTSLYNQNPEWLKKVQHELDAAVAVAYGWDDYTSQMPAEAILARLFKLNLSRSEDLFASNQKLLEPVSIPRRKRKPDGQKSQLKKALSKQVANG